MKTLLFSMIAGFALCACTSTTKEEVNDTVKDTVKDTTVMVDTVNDTVNNAVQCECID